MIYNKRTWQLQSAIPLKSGQLMQDTLPSLSDSQHAISGELPTHKTILLLQVLIHSYVTIIIIHMQMLVFIILQSRQ